MKRGLVAFAVLTLSACVDEPTPKDAETAAAAIEKDATADEIKAQQLSIEQAADEAVKLIEADAKAEIDANATAEK